ncbi:hypothetical protein [Streptomyces spinosus]|nr:hypothetical protein [Streptomyces spinosus]
MQISTGREQDHVRPADIALRRGLSLYPCLQHTPTISDKRLA